MEGINLSSSLQEKKQRESRFFSGSFVVLFIFFFLLTLWGGMRWYMKTQNDTLARNDALLEANSSQLKGPAVDRVVAFDTRLTLAKDQANDFIDIEIFLNQLENLSVPAVQLTKYEFNKKDKFVIIEGETDNFKYIAQQLNSLRVDNLFAGIQVESIKKDENGRILFSFKAEF